MNAKILAILFLCMATFVCAQSAPSLGKSAPREHRGFYNSASFGFAYNWYDASKEGIDRYSDKVERGIDYVSTMVSPSRKWNLSSVLPLGT